MSTRPALLSSWHAAQRRADTSGAVVLTAASFAGYALEQSGGQVHRARGLVPGGDSGGDSLFWARVRSILDDVEREEREAAPAVVRS